MNISIRTDNCDYETPIHFDDIESKVIMGIGFSDRIPTIQSKKDIREALTKLVLSELTKFKWFSYGTVWAELDWYIDSEARQETDKFGDLDNITKPIIDSLTGINGLFIDDSQIKSIYTRWLAKNSNSQNQILNVTIRFLNDETLIKEKTYFIQYYNAMCFPIDLNPSVKEDLKKIKLFAEAKLAHRKLNDELKSKGVTNSGFMLIASQKDFHKTRLSNIPSNRIFSIQ